MTVIDYSKPVETCEDPPRPVRVLATDAYGAWPIVVMIDGLVVRLTVEGKSNDGCHYLRNVAPKPPEVVRHERWWTLLADGRACGPYPSQQDADKYADIQGSNRVGTLHHAWNNDGSPVPGECDANLSLGIALEWVQKVEAERDEWKRKAERLDADIPLKWQPRQDELTAKAEALEAEVAEWKAKAERLESERDNLTAAYQAAQQVAEGNRATIKTLAAERDNLTRAHQRSLVASGQLRDKVRDLEYGLAAAQKTADEQRERANRMCPVVDAAVEWKEYADSISSRHKLTHAVRAYQQSTPPTDAEIKESVEAVGKMMPSKEMMREAALLIEKRCATCKLGYPAHMRRTGVPCGSHLRLSG